MTKILGGAGGGGSSPNIVSDNLRSQDSIEFILGICEGPIAGLVQGPKSFYLNDTPLTSPGGDNNFEAFELHMYHGDANASNIVPKFGGVSSNVQVGVQLAQYVPVVRTTPQNLQGQIDRIEIRLAINQLLQTNDDGDQLENTARFKLRYRKSTETEWRWFTSTDETTVTGKTGSTYVKEYVRAIPPGDRSYTGDWEIYVEKLNDEQNEDLFCTVTFESFQCVQVDNSLAFDNLALIRGLGAASNQFSSIPSFTGIYAGKIIRIPSNYNPITRVYDGTWDGTFQWGYSDNPAWCLYDMIRDENYGFKKYYPQVQVDRWSFYEAAQWCDVLVPRTGSTGYQPRYTYHDLIDQPRPGIEAAQYVASIFGGIITTDLNGTVRLKLDKPGNPVQIFGPESVTAEGFQYQFADMASRANDFLVTFVNPDLKWNQDVRQVKVDSYINTNGRIPMDFVAVGCIDAFEAQRRALLRLISANTEVTTVTFSTARPGILLEPFDIIGITDPYMNWGLSGRIKSVANGVITLRDQLFLTANATYTMTVQSNTGPVDVVVQNTGGAVSTQLTRVSGSLLQDIPANAQFALTSDTIGLVKPFRILSISEGEAGSDLFTISAIEINVNKYGDADQLDITPEPSVKYSFERSMIPPAPVNITCESGTNQLFVTSDGRINSRIYVTWDHDPSAFVEEYQVFYKRLDRDTYSRMQVTGPEAYISNVQDGMTYQIYVRAKNSIGNRSPSSAVVSHVVVGKSAPPSSPTTATTLQLGSDVRIDWDDVNDLDLDFYEIRTGGSNWQTASRIGTSKASIFTHANVTGSNIVYRIKSVDTSGNYSTNALTVTHAIPTPGAITLTGSFSNTSLILSWNPPPSTLPITGYVVRNKTGDLILDADLKATTYQISLDWFGLREFEVWAVNSAGLAGPVATASFTIGPPAVVNLQSQLVKSQLNLSWTGVRGTLPIKQYHVYIGESYMDPLLFSVGIPGEFPDNAVVVATLDAQNWSTPVDWNGYRVYAVAAEDTGGNMSRLVHVTERVDAPPAVAVSSVIVDKSLRLTWEEPESELRIREYEVWRDNQLVQKVSATTALVPINFSGVKTYRVRAVDEAGNKGDFGDVSATINAPGVMTLNANIVSNLVRLSWDTPTSTLPISEYAIMRGASNQELTRVSANSFSLVADFADIETFSIQAIDIAGNVSTVASKTVEVSAPAAPTVRPEVLDNNVLLRWTNNPGTLPVRTTEIRRGSTFATATVLQQADATFAPFFEFTAGTYTYWVVNIDTAGNYGIPTGVSAVVSQPQDFVLQASFDSAFGGTKTRVYPSGGKLYFGVNDTETFQQHWTSIGTSTVQDQINAGYPYWLQPTSGQGSSYQETFDYGAMIASSMITITPTIEQTLGNSTLQVDIDVKANLGDAWTSLTVNSPQGFATSFRYVRFTLRATGDSKDDLLVVSKINVRLSTKSKSDSGNGVASASDTGGTTVNFNVSFIDIVSITVTPLSTGARFAVYDFVDIANPTSFKVLMYDTSGNRVSGNFSWTARGY